MSEIIDRDVKTKERYGKEKRLLNILKKLVKSIKQKSLRASQKMKSFLYIIMVILGTTCAEALIWHLQVKLEKLLN